MSGYIPSLVHIPVWKIRSIRSRNKQMMSQSSDKNTTEVNVLFIVFPIFTLNQVEYTSSDMASEISTYLCSIYETLLMWRIITTILVLPFH